MLVDNQSWLLYMYYPIVCQLNFDTVECCNYILLNASLSFCLSQATTIIMKWIWYAFINSVLIHGKLFYADSMTMQIVITVVLSTK